MNWFAVCSTLFFTCGSLAGTQHPPLVNFEEGAQDFVLETKQIQIPGYPTAFNPSIIRLYDSILMSFRVRDPITLSTHQIGFVWLDKDFNVASKPQLLDTSFYNPYLVKRLQDPRLIVVHGKIYMIYNNVIGPLSLEIRRMMVAELHLLHGKFHVHSETVLTDFEGEGRYPREKNWVPFVYEDSLLLGYTIVPHKVFLPLLGSNKCETISTSKGNIQWEWGDLRGGTQAHLVDDQYLGFYHSSKDLYSAHSPDAKIAHYFIGAYTFSSQPPFEITRVSPEPIVAPDFYHGPEYKTWKPLKVVFPGGFIFDENNIWIAYGKQDHEIWIVKLDKKGLYDSLIPVETVEVH